MADLTTTYLGLHLKNPLVASASPLSKNVDAVKRLEEAGIAAIVMYSLFEEQITHVNRRHDPYDRGGAGTFTDTPDYLPDLHYLMGTPDLYLAALHRITQAVSIPVIGSLNGFTPGSWVEYAYKMELAGAAALEVNPYYLSNDLRVSSIELEDTYVNLVRDVMMRVHIPVSIKLTPFFTALPYFAQSLVNAGAKGLVLFNRFYQPDFDLETLKFMPNLELSTSYDSRLPMHWIAMLYGRIHADLALSSGIHTAQDVIKATMAGASVTMMASELLAHGSTRVKDMLAEIDMWLTQHDHASLGDIKGMMGQFNVVAPAAFERAGYIRTLNSDTNPFPQSNIKSE